MNNIKRTFTTDDANKCIIVTSTVDNGKFYLKDFKNIDLDLESKIKANETNIKILEKAIADTPKVANKEKLYQHRKEHELIQKLEMSDKLIKDLEGQKNELEGNLKQQVEVRENIKYLEVLDG